jgi:RNA polymerase sigma factor (TIGR02999 family)
MNAARITQLLDEHASGNKEAIDSLMPLVYDKMRSMAHHRLLGERSDHTLNTTGVVHEAYLKLVRFDKINYRSSAHFFAIASQVMRNILVDYAVRKKADKRGAGRGKVTLDDRDAPTELDLDRIISVHQALERLSEIDQRQARVVEYRFFGGLDMQETAQALDISTRTAQRDWNIASAWLHRELNVQAV